MRNFAARNVKQNTINVMSLKEILSSFNGGASSEEIINEVFARMAKQLLYGGHFRVLNSKNIYLEEIEFYYHEEDGRIKDPIMYHTNDHEGKQVSYYKLGRFNMHTSGVDVTFENEEKQYRASFLIRAYRVDNNPIETRSTYIYDDMFGMGIPFDEPIEIEWVEDKMDDNVKALSLKGTWRKNVPEYKRDEDGCYVKGIDGKYIKEETTEVNDNTFAYGKSRYVKCHKPWRFIKH